MSATAFILLTGLAVLMSAGIALLLRPPPDRPVERRKGHTRWAVYRFYPERFRSGEGPALEGLPDGPSFRPEAPLDPDLPRLRLLEGRRGRIAVHRRRGFGRISLVVRVDGRPIALVRAPRRPRGLFELHAAELKLILHGNAGRMELELRRGGKLVASISPRIAALPGAVGMEVLAEEEPLPILAVAAGLVLLEELLAGAPCPVSAA